MPDGVVLLSQSISIAVSFSVMLLLFTIGMQGAPFYAVFITSFLSYFTIWGGLRYLTLAIGDGDSLIPAFPGEMFLKNKVTEDIRQGNAAVNQELERLRMQQAYDRKEFVANEEAEARMRPPVRASLKNDLPNPVSELDFYKGYKDDLKSPFKAIRGAVEYGVVPAAKGVGKGLYYAANGVKNVAADVAREGLAFAGDAGRAYLGVPPANPDRVNGMYARERERAEAERFERYRKENLEREDRQRQENMQREDRLFNKQNQQQQQQQQQQRPQQQQQQQQQYRPVDPNIVGDAAQRRIENEEARRASDQRRALSKERRERDERLEKRFKEAEKAAAEERERQRAAAAAPAAETAEGTAKSSGSRKRGGNPEGTATPTRGPPGPNKDGTPETQPR